jgi:hypothetical protein
VHRRTPAPAQFDSRAAQDTSDSTPLIDPIVGQPVDESPITSACRSGETPA